MSSGATPRALSLPCYATARRSLPVPLQPILLLSVSTALLPVPPQLLYGNAQVRRLSNRARLVAGESAPRHVEPSLSPPRSLASKAGSSTPTRSCNLRPRCFPALRRRSQVRRYQVQCCPRLRSHMRTLFRLSSQRCQGTCYALGNLFSLT